MIITDKMLLKQIDAFLKRTKMPHTRLGLDALGDGGLVKGLREGRSPSLRNAEKLVRFMENWRPAKSAGTEPQVPA